VAVASGLNNARQLMEEVKNGNKNNYHFIEIMACPGGCLNGGGMPLHNPNVVSFEERSRLRAKAIYKQDENLPIRKSHENPSIIQLYKEFYEKPGSHKAHELLHSDVHERKFI
jgi:NADP-reducing hydrogenase subunit HndD